KGLAGPQNSGLVVGKASLVRAMQLNGPPYQRIGRAMKVSKEAMVGLLAAVELYLSKDHEAEAATWSAVVDSWLTAWQSSSPQGIAVTRAETGEAGEPIPRIIMRFTPEATIDRDGFVAALRRDDPAIEVVLNDATSIAFSPHVLQPGEAAIVKSRVDDLLGGLASSIPAGIPATRAV
ncbi:MAG: D-glucosaminate-6-phosphate ammonia-lyase, partial [Thermomicrobiales bacterium]|nr:D-glucosaminate-6-phosphate ammonia-lyase [Thermomicrobiales bacterium]